MILGVLVLMFAGLGYLVSGFESVHWGIVVGAGFASVFFFRSPQAILKRYRARPLAPPARDRLEAIVASLAREAGLDDVPEVLTTTRDCDAFSVATPRRATIVVGEGLLDGFEDREVRAILAHEISHVKNHDTVVLGVADLVVRMTRTIASLGLVLVVANLGLDFLFESHVPWGFVAALVITPWLARTLFSVLGRARERRADVDAAALTNDPMALAAALERLEGLPKPKKSVLRAMNPYGIAPAPSNLRNHPPTAVRIARLEALARR